MNKACKCPICGELLKQCLVPNVLAGGTVTAFGLGGPAGAVCGAALHHQARMEILARKMNNEKQRYYCLKCKQYVEI